MLGMLLLAAPVNAGSYVIEHEDLRTATRAVRIANRVADRVVAVSGRAICVDLPEDREAKVLRRVERKLGRAPEVRRDCDVAFFPKGRGWFGIVLDPPANGLEAVIEEVGPESHVIGRTPGTTLPVRLCVPAAAVPEPMDLSGQLAERDLSVRAVYEVGGCRRP